MWPQPKPDDFAVSWQSFLPWLQLILPEGLLLQQEAVVAVPVVEVVVVVAVVAVARQIMTKRSLKNLLLRLPQRFAVSCRSDTY